MTQKEKITLFDDITEFALTNPSDEQIGKMVLGLLKANNCIADCEKCKNPTKFTKNEQEVINAVKNGWTFWRVDGVTWYWVNNIVDGPSPLQSLYRAPNLKVVSSRILNKLVKSGKFPKNYKFRYM